MRSAVDFCSLRMFSNLVLYSFTVIFSFFFRSSICLWKVSRCVLNFAFWSSVRFSFACPYADRVAYDLSAYDDFFLPAYVVFHLFFPVFPGLVYPQLLLVRLPIRLSFHSLIFLFDANPLRKPSVWISNGDVGLVKYKLSPFRHSIINKV